MGVGTNLKRLRTKTKFSQQDIADQLNIDRVTYANWENETFDIKSQYIPKLADIFEVEIKDLFEEEKTFHISNNTFNDSAGVIVFNLSDKKIAEKLSLQIEELINNLKK
ncbi:hypothetical protein GCM10023210_22730 [Chryseobacterium ginsengisoli]|uniref:HTH cro/C1-type domain-containing protein n=1 Tax=Chryseobacterium ginsengisoli TaxID=363853 RepID=A0ABP9M9L5_9FLAO